MPDKEFEFWSQGNDNAPREWSALEYEQTARFLYALAVGLALAVVLFALVSFVGP